MKIINVFALSILLVALALYFLQNYHQKNIISFYGYAENKETEINFNYPVQVRKIHVSPGQLIKKNMDLLDVSRIESKHLVQDQPFKIEKIVAEKKIWRSKLEGQIKLLEDQKQKELDEINRRKEKIKTDKLINNSLYDELETIVKPEHVDTKTKTVLTGLNLEYENVVNIYEQRIENKKKELLIGSQPYDSEIQRLTYEQNKKHEQALVDISVKASEDCLIGNVYCKESEHFNSYKTLLSVYEPNPSIIKGFIQENFIMKISLNDSILVKSTKDKNLSYKGKVIGLGSRIVEIPSRLRKRPDIKTYGREVIVSIPKHNRFLQKEKTVLELLQKQSNAKASKLLKISEAK